MNAATQVNLAALIRQHQAATGQSYGDIAKASGLSKAKIGQLATVGSPHMPRAETIEKLARGLRLPLAVVQRAAMSSGGLMPKDQEPDERLALLTARLRALSSDDLERVELFVQALAGRRG